jgi:hypothetical protein
MPDRVDRGGVDRVRGRDRKRGSGEPGGCGRQEPLLLRRPELAVRYYPRFMTYFQKSLGGVNRIAGPNRVGPLYGFVVSINVDTIYASFYLDLSQGPQVFTIPKTGVTYSLLTLDVFGDVFKTNIQPQTPGTYALVPAGFTGTLPPGVTEVQVPYPLTTWIIRADKYSSSGQNQIDQATAFRASLRLASLPTYESNPAAGAATLLPQAALRCV